MKSPLKGTRRCPAGLAIRLTPGEHISIAEGLHKIHLVRARGGKNAHTVFRFEGPGMAKLIGPARLQDGKVLKLFFTDRIELMGGQVKIILLEVTKDMAQLKFQAPREIKILRSELVKRDVEAEEAVCDIY